MIKAGDLVMVVRPAKCCGKGALGHVFTVEGISSCLPTYCRDCGTDRDPSEERAIGGTNSYCCETSRLKKIDPPATGEYDRVPQKLKEPA